MNKLILIAVTALITAIYPLRASASDITIGATTWYTAWDYEDDDENDIEYDPAFLYGPVLSLAITPELSMSFVFLYGEFTMKVENDPAMDLNRYDSDLTLNYRISNYFKLFAGAKYMGFTWDPGTHRAIGPGVGVSAVFPVGNDFFLLGYISGMYLKGNEDENERDYSEKTNEYGGNASLSLAYYIPDASTTISLGGRYQQLKIDYIDPDTTNVSDSMSRFYGVTLTAVYTFNI